MRKLVARVCFEKIPYYGTVVVHQRNFFVFRLTPYRLGILLPITTYYPQNLLSSTPEICSYHANK